jgi:hypothetical protein
VVQVALEREPGQAPVVGLGWMLLEQCPGAAPLAPAPPVPVLVLLGAPQEVSRVTQ